MNCLKVIICSILCAVTAHAQVAAPQEVAKRPEQALAQALAQLTSLAPHLRDHLYRNDTLPQLAKLQAALGAPNGILIRQGDRGDWVNLTAIEEADCFRRQFSEENPAVRVEEDRVLSIDFRRRQDVGLVCFVYAYSAYWASKSAAAERIYLALDFDGAGDTLLRIRVNPTQEVYSFAQPTELAVTAAMREADVRGGALSPEENNNLNLRRGLDEKYNERAVEFLEALPNYTKVVEFLGER